jgi:hypothetical protein
VYTHETLLPVNTRGGKGGDTGDLNPMHATVCEGKHSSIHPPTPNPVAHLSLPVKNFRNIFFSSRLSSALTMLHSHCTAGVEVEKPPSYLALRSNASKSRLGLPHTRRSTSQALNSLMAGPSHRMRKPAAKASNWRCTDLGGGSSAGSSAGSGVSYQ